MLFENVEIWTQKLDPLAVFYRDILGLPVNNYRIGTRLEVKLGQTRMLINQNSDVNIGHYHLAFDIPENQFQAGFTWLKARTQPAANARGQVLFQGDSWNADSVYFADPDGNILELIARHNQPTSSQGEFSASNLLSISEFGIASQDVPATVRTLCDTLSVQPYDGAGSQIFTAVGDENGLLIVVQRYRVWMPGTGKPADYVPFRLQVRNEQDAIFHISAPEYPLEINPSE